MLIRIVASSSSIEIDDAQNFKEFKVRIEGLFVDSTAQTELLRRVAPRCDREHAWISEKVLREWPSLGSQPWWQEGLSKMIVSVERFGWIDRVDHSIRAHIEYLR